jgi:hypothetical protein
LKSVGPALAFMARHSSAQHVHKGAMVIAGTVSSANISLRYMTAGTLCDSEIWWRALLLVSEKAKQVQTKG